MFHQLSIEVLYTNILPLLDLPSLCKLHIAVPALRPAIEHYKDWDLEYGKLFPEDVAKDSRTGFDRIHHRVYAKPMLWGIVACLTEYGEGGLIRLADISRPHHVDMSPLTPPIRQFVSDQVVVMGDGTFACHNYIHRPWRTEASQHPVHWPKNVPIQHDEDHFWCSNGTVLHVGEDGWRDEYWDGDYQEDPETPLEGQIIWAEIITPIETDETLVLLDSGLYRSNYCDDRWLSIPASAFPEEMYRFCSLPPHDEVDTFAFLAKSGKVYAVHIEVDGLEDVDAAESTWTPLEYPCHITSISRYGEFSMTGHRKDGGWLLRSGVTSPHDRQLENGWVALGVDGHVYLRDGFSDTCVRLEGLEDIVKVQAGNWSLVALDKYGRVFSMGDGRSLGFGDHPTFDVVAADPSILNEEGTGPDLLKVLSRMDLVSECSQPQPDWLPWNVRPRLIDIPGFVVDVNAINGEYSALVVR